MTGILTVLAISTVLAPSKWVVAYVPNWVELKTFSKEIDYAKLTHINVAFENPTNDAGDLSFGSDVPVLVKDAHDKGVKVLVSIGGGSASEDDALLKRYSRLTSEARRAGFVAKLADYVTKYKFDGLDVDLEGPAIGKDYGAFIDELSVALKKKGKLLTAALSRGYGGDKVPVSVFDWFEAQWASMPANTADRERFFAALHSLASPLPPMQIYAQSVRSSCLRAPAAWCIIDFTWYSEKLVYN